MMITKRLWFKKTDSLKYISHLDFNRYMARYLKMTGLPLWYTEGFNPHLYMVFALPLSLGMTGIRESLDIRITEEMSNEEVLSCLNNDKVSGLSFYDVTDPKMKIGDVVFAKYEVLYSSELLSPDELVKKWLSFSSCDSIVIEKKSKSGSKPFDIAGFIHCVEPVIDGESVKLSLILPAGNEENLNPRLIGDEFGAFCGSEVFQNIERTALLNKNKALFE